MLVVDLGGAKPVVTRCIGEERDDEHNVVDVIQFLEVVPLFDPRLL